MVLVGGPIRKVRPIALVPLWCQSPRFFSPPAAVMRIGMEEVKDFCLEYFPSTQERTFLEESCGIADIITSCELKHLTYFPSDLFLSSTQR